MGSYRRGSENSGDVDILITRDTEDGRTHAGVMKKLIKGLVADGIITHEVCQNAFVPEEESGLQRNWTRTCQESSIDMQLSLPHDWDELEAKWMGVCRLPGGLHRRIGMCLVISTNLSSITSYAWGKEAYSPPSDILCIPFEQWGAALLYFTGKSALALIASFLYAPCRLQEWLSSST